MQTLSYLLQSSIFSILLQSLIFVYANNYFCPLVHVAKLTTTYTTISYIGNFDVGSECKSWLPFDKTFAMTVFLLLWSLTSSLTYHFWFVYVIYEGKYSNPFILDLGIANYSLAVVVLVVIVVVARESQLCCGCGMYMVCMLNEVVYKPH